ncbi:hypothetical protein C7389_12055 [Azoarcus indigens]|uniref:EF-hand domain-containing protein n=2 Tax=Azoarcus indigens TaxID=29545 RepID=A0A4R6DT04_9RHOO|nr:hypothetical protein C7389_12055 [Azoarcus indigens]
MKRMISGVALAALLGLAAGMAASGVRAAEPAAQEGAARMKERLQERFAAADTNRDGSLSEEEAKAGMPFVHRHFGEIDNAGKGSVTQAQVEAYITAQAASRRGSR